MDINLSFNNDSLCRVCLVEVKNKKPLDSVQSSDQRTLFDILNYVVNLQIKRDVHLPKHICINCEDTLLKADFFKRQCLESEAIIDATLNNVECAKNVVLDTNDCKENQDFHNLNSTDTTITSYQCSVCFVKLSNVSLLEDHVAAHNGKISALAINDLMPPLSLNSSNNINEDRPPPALEKEELELDYCIKNNYLEHYESDCSNIDVSPLTIKQEDSEIQSSIPNLYEEQFQNHVQQTNINNHCEVTFKNEFDLLNESLEKKIALKATCTTCHERFKTIEDRKKHKCKLRKNNTKTSNSKLGKSFQCTQCHHSFSRSYKLQRHLKTHEEQKYICTICKREFKYQTYLDKHFISQHSHDKNYPCDTCPKTFATNEGLLEHTKKHSSKKEHQCHICKKVFFMSSTLKDHLRIHTGEKPFLCSVCGKGFSQRNNLTQHMRRHLGLKPFRCDNCELSFVSKGELQAHTRKHSGAHPFVCNVCGNGFTTSSSLVKHRRIHTGERPYACDLCPMRFRASGTLKNHKRTHSGEKPYQCSLCDRAFVQRHDLVSHIRCHTGERPYVCTECGQSFRKANALKVHGKLHVKEPVAKICLVSGDGEV